MKTNVYIMSADGSAPPLQGKTRRAAETGR